MFSTRIRTLVRQQWAGLIALFLVLSGGSAYALDGSNTVFSDDIVDGQVKEADVGQGAVASPEVKNDSIVAGDVAPNSLTSPRIADGSLTGTDVANNSLKGADIDEDTLVGGPTNPTGPAGGDLAGTYPNPELALNAVGFGEIADGVVGSFELGHIETRRASTSVPPAGGNGSVRVDCPDFYKRLGGGASFDFPSGDLSSSEPDGTLGWFAEGQNNGTVAQNLEAAVVCLAP
jgi:hypothetical protein